MVFLCELSAVKSGQKIFLEHKATKLFFFPSCTRNDNHMKKLFIIAFLLISYNVSAQKTHQNLIDSLFFGKNGIKSKYPYVGLSIGIIKNGTTYFYTFGKKSHDSNELIDKNTIFEVGSATKTFTGLLLAIEIVENKIGKNDFIDDYLPVNFRLAPALKRKVKVTDLVSHQSGLPNLSNDKYLDQFVKKNPKNPFSLIDKKALYEILSNADSLKGFQKYQYNNFAYALLGELIERKAKSSYHDLLSKKLF
jgi:CubicO group peptidase (beta-lactamase class C family)